MIISAVINGFGAAILWVAQGYYIADCANKQNKGFFYSYFWAIFMLSQILGNLIASLVIGNGTLTLYYIIMSTFCFLGSFLFLLLK